MLQVGDLQFASPATVSRCGMVFVDSRNLGYMPYVNTWLVSRYVLMMSQYISQSRPSRLPIYGTVCEIDADWPNVQG